MADDKPPKVLEWHRVEGAIVGALAIGAGILFLGPSFGALAFIVFKNAPTIRLVLAIIAILCVLGGPTYAISRLVHALREDASLTARRDGVTFERNGKSIFLAWESIDRVEFEEPTTLRFCVPNDPFVLHERFGDIATSELAKRLEELRRKAAFGLLVVLVLFTACVPAPSSTSSGPSATTTRADPCRDDIPDCAAVCALRETNRSAYVDFYERRCAAVILGKNPDRLAVVIVESAVDGGAEVTTVEGAHAVTTAVPFNPANMPRTVVPGEPAECKAARLLRAQHHDREADVLSALCSAKGGDGDLLDRR